MAQNRRRQTLAKRKNMHKIICSILAYSHPEKQWPVACAHPAPAARIWSFFLREGEGDRGRWRTDSATNLHKKAFGSCKFFVYLASGDFAPRPPLGLRHWTLLGPVPTLTSEPGYTADSSIARKIFLLQKIGVWHTASRETSHAECQGDRNGEEIFPS